MTREEFDGAITAHYRQVVKMAQAEVRRQRVAGLQGEDIVAEIVATLLKWNRYEKIAFDTGFPLGYFANAIPSHVIDHIRTVSGATEGAQEARAKYHATDRIPADATEQAHTHAEIRAIAERVILAIEEETNRELARMVYLEGQRPTDAFRKLGLEVSGYRRRFLAGVKTQLQEALQEYKPN